MFSCFALTGCNSWTSCVRLMNILLTSCFNLITGSLNFLTSCLFWVLDILSPATWPSSPEFLLESGVHSGFVDFLLFLELLHFLFVLFLQTLNVTCRERISFQMSIQIKSNVWQRAKNPGKLDFFRVIAIAYRFIRLNNVGYKLPVFYFDSDLAKTNAKWGKGHHSAIQNKSCYRHFLL